MRSLWRVAVEIWRALRFELLPSFGTFLTIFLALVLPGIIWVTAKNLAIIESELKSGITMDVFLRDETTSSDISRLEDEFRKLSGVNGTRFVSKEEAMEKMRQRFGAEMLSGLDDNPLPASFVLNVDQEIFKPGAAEALTKKIRSHPEVEDVVFAGEILTRLGRIMASVRTLGLALTLLVAFAAVFIVANTIRLVISDRRKTVEIMQMVGATRGYILSPFVLLGGLLGLAGAGAAVAALAWSAGYISEHLTRVVFLEWHEVLAFTLAGLLLGMLGAIVATRRYLKI